ncbi:MAG: hypothetical protein HY758_00250 [Nitrospirae bacterium]|nr:hypothetical protein [Nitrospirota bacterium]
MDNETLIHNWLVTYLRRRLSRDYKDISVNLDGEKKNAFKGCYPDLILGNHGLTLAVMEVETEVSVTPEKAEQWKSLTGLGVKLIIMVPKPLKAKVVDLLWKNGIADKAAVGSYEMQINMP